VYICNRISNNFSSCPALLQSNMESSRLFSGLSRAKVNLHHHRLLRQQGSSSHIHAKHTDIHAHNLLNLRCIFYPAA